MSSFLKDQSSDIGFDELDDVDVDYPRKRRRLSQEAESVEDSPRKPQVLHTESRIKPRKEGSPKPLISEEIQLRNGKVVDATSSFATIGVAPWLIASLAAMAIQRPTTIQKGCIPQILNGKDVIGGSKTGSGKTVAFAVPILQTWAEDPMGIFAVILTPTR